MSAVFVALLFAVASTAAYLACATEAGVNAHGQSTYGVRPYYLVEDMKESTLKKELTACYDKVPKKSTLSAGYGGAPVQFAEHTKESYIAAARMGAGVLGCDVTFTKDRHLVCRKSQCDLHLTTNILITPLAAKCSKKFIPASGSGSANALCCTSDITLAEYKTLQGKVSSSYSLAKTAAEYMTGVPSWRTDWYSSPTKGGTLMTHKESIKLFKELGVKYSPMLTEPMVKMPFAGYSYEKYAFQLVEEYSKEQVKPGDLWLHTSLLEVYSFWKKTVGSYAVQTVYVDERFKMKSFDHTKPSTYGTSMMNMQKSGLKTIAAPIWMLLAEKDGKIMPSVYANEAKAAGLNIETYAFEASGSPPAGEYYKTVPTAMKTDGDIYNALDFLVKEVGVARVYSEWPSTVTYYANCYGH